MAAQSSSSSNQGAADDSSAWQRKLEEVCSELKVPQPNYQMFSDHRGNRVAWSCEVEVLGKSIAARFWYDGRNVNGAREDAALEAYRYIYDAIQRVHGNAQ